MSTARHRIEQLEVCHREMFGDLVLTCQMPGGAPRPQKVVQTAAYPVEYRRTSSVDSMMKKTSIMESERRRASALVDELLMDIYYDVHVHGTTDYNSATSGKSHKSSWTGVVNLQDKDAAELRSILSCLETHVERMGSVLVRRLRRRDALRRQQEAYCDVITKRLVKRDSEEGTASAAADMRFTIQPAPGESGFSQWAAAMKMVAQLPGGIPPEFRRRLWLTLADRHLRARGVDWPQAERSCFSEWSHPADAELGVQIVKDLHRTGCSLFCGEDGQENQALLKRVLLAYARWNKAVGYCQGFNMLAALILQVTDRCESDALKLMIYLIEGVLPDSYFADSLRGLSVDMAVFRELLRGRLPRLSRHLDALQNAAKDGARSYEPPLTNVFTMQWFLTLFCNCLPQPTVLRVWDLILLEGNEILLRTALAIWQVLAEKILSVRSADEFYCIMGVLTRELLEFGLVDGNSLIKAVIAIGPLTELKSLREHYLYNINPWGPSLPQAVVEKQLKLYTRQSIALDISALKKQYAKLKQRQRQAHIIFTAAITRQAPPSAPVTMNHLLLGKSALVPAKRLGPPKGAIPPARQTPSTLLWKDTPKQSSSSSSSDTELCDDDESSTEEESGRKSQFEDNLPPDSDNILMRTDNDNTTSAKTKPSAGEPEEELDVEANPLDVDQSLPTDDDTGISETGDTFDTAPPKTSSESDDENFDFEQFLADRVKFLKDDGTAVVEEPDERINYARRNSAKALQIIQENSLILHRILQCQSRLSPSPPHHETVDVHFQEHVGANAEQTDMPSPDHSHESRPEIDTIIFPDPPTQILLEGSKEALKSPEYGSRYTSILEKSKSLDEKYNALILNIPPLKQSVSEQRSITRICEEKPKCNNKDTFKEDALFNRGSFSHAHKGYGVSSPKKYEVITSFKEEICLSPAHQSNNLPKLVHPEPYVGNFEIFSPDHDSAGTEKTYPYSDIKDNSWQSPNNEYSPGATYQMYDDFSCKFPTPSSKDEHFSTLDLHSYSWKEKLDDTISTFNFSDFTISSNEADSGLGFLKSSMFNLDLSPVKSKYSLTDTNEFKSDENGHTDISSKDSFAVREEDNSKSDEDSSFYKDLMSQLHKIEGSSGTICKELSSEHSCLEITTEEPKEALSPTVKYDVSEYQSQLKDSTRYSRKLEVKSPNESNKKSFTLGLTSNGEGSSSKSPLKSPSKTFNPFPVPLSSRQSKEVPLKLGLYKK